MGKTVNMEEMHIIHPINELTYFFSEQQIEAQLLALSTSLGIAALLGICFTKMLAICFTIHGGFRGDLSFPYF